MARRVSNDAGIYYSDRGNFALEGILRTGFNGSNVGLRLGVVDPGGPSDELVSLGAELRSPVAVSSAPLDLGVDLAFSPTLAVRFGAGLGNPQAEWGIGLSWRR